ncbi:MAG: adenylate/guanylate cyclase domain-containing response regulator [Candidatus Brocadia sp. AMX2]|uniref:Adenylate cyclase family 3 n=1 Tax=Candidatus Brocadia sinica JPN1 TaxID=1197129 RepID=A0ABQ0JXE3_9BACT|nr:MULTISPECIES: adenylate/guanylate cyclase domain-containing response regulator [Brocadia]KXK29425.1 MAG: putative adenylate/guanylate cyclase [Candidatus Brocadia sinica]MBC6933787.1 adenylate/guanylate cyclase domain-containing response regulator [Candidatus Brocadia sp.]MBL1170522.1 response regulator [Candidatus Brocadia sp. AMX1]NOG40750.1 response regulator [Planctomycetota bacterium]KAA0242724.1 MAG: response regulator [Candidatus Brocadia sp. AMX2]
MANELSDKICIMLVDDDLSMLQTTAAVLEEEGYNVLACSAGKEAIDEFHDAVFAMVLDINMPDISGLEVFEIIKSRNRYVPIIFHTGYDEREKRIDIRRHFRPHAYVVKGSDPEQLLDTVAGAVESYKSIRENIVLNETLRERNKLIEEFNRSLEDKVKRQVEEIQRTSRLKRYVSPQIAESIVSSGSDKYLMNARKLLTICFSDLKGFTEASESMEPEDTIKLLNEYFTEMTKIIFQYGGTLDKFIGDGILVFFGDPIMYENHAERAVRMAIDMREKVRDLRNHWLEMGCNIDIYFGINTGYATVGNIGSAIQMNYTVIGHQVNIAHRLQMEARPGQILVTARTLSEIKDIVETEEIRQVKLKGIHKPVDVYNVLRCKR